DLLKYLRHVCGGGGCDEDDLTAGQRVGVDIAQYDDIASFHQLALQGIEFRAERVGAVHAEIERVPGLDRPLGKLRKAVQVLCLEPVLRRLVGPRRRDAGEQEHYAEAPKLQLQREWH